MDGVLIRVAIIGLTMTIVPVVVLFAGESTTTSECVVKYRPFVGVIGAMGLLTICIAITAILLTEGFSHIIFLLLPIMIGCLYLLLASIFWRIYFQDSGFIFKNRFGMKRRYDYSEITKIIDRDKEKYSIYLGKKKITVEYMTVNSELFLKKILRENAKKNLNMEIIYKQKKRNY